MRTTHTKRFSRALALIPVALVLSVPAAAQQILNEPPAMPDAMRNAGEGQRGQGYSAVSVSAKHTVRIDGTTVTVRESVPDSAGFAVPDAEGGFVWMPAEAQRAPAGLADARELKLKVRELAAQLIAGMDPGLRGMVAIPTSFVNQEDFSQSSPLGRFIAELLFHEFNQRGFPVREYRMAPSVTVRDDGEFLLSRKVSGVSTKDGGNLFVVGTCFTDRQAVFVNARLVRGNGMVLRTAQLVLPNTALTRRMAAGGGKTLKAGTLPIRDFKTTTQPVNLTPIDIGEDVH